MDLSRVKGWAVRWGRWLAIAVVLAGLGYFVHEMDWAALGAALAAVPLWLLALCSVLSFVNMFCKAACWRILFAPRHQVSSWRLFRYTVVAFAISAVTPARAGELLRIWLLRSRDGVPATDALAVAAGEKLLNVVSMLVLVAPLPWLMPQLPRSVSYTIAGISAGSLLVLLGLWIALGRVESSGGPFQRFIAGMHALRRPGGFSASMAVLLIGWFADLAQVWLVLWALGIALPPAAGLLVLLTLNIAIAVPSTPASVGSLELGALAALLLLGVPREQGLAFALLYHGAQILPLIVVGLLDIRFVLAARRAQAGEPASTPVG